MKKKLKKYLIPSEENGHKPHLLRDKVMNKMSWIIFCIEVFTIALVASFLPTKLDYLASVISSVLVDKTNETRLEKNLSELTVNPTLVKAAELKAADMAEKGYFSHVTPDGKQPWYFMAQAGYEYEVAGEKRAVNFVDSNDVHKALMNSPTHKANILKERYTEIGIATAKGDYRGKSAIFVVEFFGKPKVAVAQANVPVSNNNKLAVRIEEPESSDSEEVKGAVVEVESIVKEEMVQEVLASEETMVLFSDNSKENVSVYGSEQGEISLFKKVVGSPRMIGSYLLYTLLAVVTLALILKVFVKIKIQHPKLILNGILLIFVLSLFLILNNKLVDIIGQVL